VVPTAMPAAPTVSVPRNSRRVTIRSPYNWS
jgi:hypothetical protein